MTDSVRVGTACLKQQLDAPVSHDNYFHSVLGLMKVQTSVYQPALDIYAGCANRGPGSVHAQTLRTESSRPS